ncbi:MAG: hypothetical protein KatS3mg076_2435 [Candidatus Binatia bacterium]|nr:MAG: hypothetical protein KatS3mg076_2435 [Candidatus Binatia bacterium]GIW56912.1 MAG: hypothetical protein KatS3mg082_3316 [Nitrospiraceae bacterium]
MTADEQTVPRPPSGLDMLVEWANGQDRWVRKLVGEVIATRRRLSDERIAALYELLLREKDLADGQPEDVPSLTASGLAASAGLPIRLVGLKHLENVNALAPNQEIEFHPRLTICFGENASGKTGYVRILKRAAAVRTAEPVLPNIHLPTKADGPRAEVRVRVGEEDRTIEWQGEQGVEPLTRIDVFDARAAVVHLAEDLSYTYTPAELSLYPLVTDGIERVQAKFEEARRSRQPQGNPFVSRFSRESALYPKIEALGPSTDLRELESAAEVTEAEEAELSGLRDQVEALRSGAVRQAIQRAEEQRRVYEAARVIADAIAEFDRDAYAGALSALREATRRHERATREALSGESVPGILGDAWKEFVEAAEAYIRQLGIEPYPQAGEPCIYCRQPLGNAAVALLQKYRDYCNAELRRAVDEARRSLEALKRPIVELGVDEAATGIERLIQAAEDPAHPPNPLVMARDCVAHARRMREAFAADQECPPFPEHLRQAPATLEAAVASIEKSLVDLRKQGEEREQALAAAQKRLRELEARRTLRDLLPQIRQFAVAAQWADRARAHLARFQGIKRSLTETAKRASTEVINREFESRFKQECEFLRAPTVNLDFPGREGEARRRKLLTPEHGLSEILSEGEQKVIALADFLAEASLKPDKSPIVFDDPVTSLDHKRLRHVVDRIVELSKERQVIVFTHDIWFAAEILGRFEREPRECVFYDVRTEGVAIGLLARGSHPRTDTFNDRRSRINTLIASAERVAGATRDALIEKAYEELRGACEVVVEKDLLRGVTERYRPNVRMTVLEQIRADRLPAAIARIMPIFEKCCGVIASHSQPMDTLGVRPTLDELRTDWQELQDARREYLE